MRSGFDLSSYGDVESRVEAIAAPPTDGCMPWDGARPKNRDDLFACWIDENERGLSVTSSAKAAPGATSG